MRHEESAIPKLRIILTTICVVLMILPCGQVFAQIDMGGVTGTVKDPSGAVVAEAQCTLTNIDTNVSQKTISTSSGAYTFEAVLAGTYSLKVVASGFKEFVLTGIQVHVQNIVTADVSLRLGAVNQQVTVTSAVPLLQAQDASLGQTVETEAVNDLPLNGRNFMSLTAIAAGSYGGNFIDGAEPGQVDARLNGVDDNLEVYGGQNIAPIPDSIEEFKLQDGDNDAEFGHSVGAVINAVTKSGTNQFHGDAFEYFRNEFLNANDWFNNLHGTRRPEYRQNQVGGTIGGPVLLPHYNGRNRTFFFFDWQYTPHVTTGSFTDTIPTGNMISSNFTNLQDLINGNSGSTADALGRKFPHGAVLDPATTRSVAAGATDPISGLTNGTANTIYVRDPFYNCTAGGCPASNTQPAGPLTGIKDFTTAGGVAVSSLNTIPASRIDPNTIAVLKLLPSPNVSSAILQNNYYAAYSQHVVDNLFDVRIDQKISDKDSLFGTISHDYGNQDGPTVFPNPLAGGALQLAFAQVKSNYESTASYTHTFAPTLVNEVRFGWDQNYYDNSNAESGVQGLPAQYGIQGIQQFAGNGGLPTFNYSGFSAFGGRRYSPTIQTTGAYDASDNLTKIVGRHEIKVGVQYVWVYADILQPAYSKGNLTWSGLYTGIPNNNQSYTGIADWLLNPTASTVGLTPGVSNNLGGLAGYNVSNWAPTDLTAPYYAVYAEDGWKVTPRLTVKAGMRWDYFSPFSEIHGNQANLVLSGAGNGTNAPVTTPGAGNGSTAIYYIASAGCGVARSSGFTAMLTSYNIPVQCTPRNTVNSGQHANIAPRVGIAYRIRPNLVARTGFGIAYGAFDSVGYGGTLGTNYPFQYTLNNPGSTSQAPLTAVGGQTATMENIFASTNIQSATSLNGLNLSLSGKQYNYSTPYDESLNFNVQYQFTNRDSIQAGYVGVLGKHLDSNSGSHNAISEILVPGTNTVLYQPFPNISSSEYLRADAISSYQSLQVVYEHHFNGGLSILGNYTFGKCLSNDTGKSDLGNGYRGQWLPGFGIGGDYSYCASEDYRHLTHVVGEYALPFGRGGQFLANANKVTNTLIGGWQINFIFTDHSGGPFTVGCPTATTAGSGCNATLAPGVNPYAGPHNRIQWLNPAAFVQPPVATANGQIDYSPLGGQGDLLRGPGFYGLDASMLKRFDTWENSKIEFRLEAFNALNDVQFGNPGQLNFTNLTNFSQITGDTSGARIVQLAVKWIF